MCFSYFLQQKSMGNSGKTLGPLNERIFQGRTYRSGPLGIKLGQLTSFSFKGCQLQFLFATSTAVFGVLELFLWFLRNMSIFIYVYVHMYIWVYIYIYMYAYAYFSTVESSTWVLFIKFPGFPPNQLGASGFIQMYHAWQLRGWRASLLDRLSWLILCWNCISFMAFLQRSCYLFVAKKVTPFVSLSELVVCRKRGAWSHGVWRFFKKWHKLCLTCSPHVMLCFFLQARVHYLWQFFPHFFCWEILSIHRTCGWKFCEFMGAAFQRLKIMEIESFIIRGWIIIYSRSPSIITITTYGKDTHLLSIWPPLFLEVLLHKKFV